MKVAVDPRTRARATATTGDGPDRGAPSHHRLVHVPALDGIRGLAVAAVLLFHGGVLTGGYLGVDAFFVLSGFLITSLLLAEHNATQRVSLSAFWTRRARRLLPALFVALLGVALFAALVASSDEYSRIRGDAFATLGYVANWHSISEGHGYWDLFQAPSPLEHAWSLAIEEQFYLVWPLLFVAVAAITRHRARRRGTEPQLPRSIFVTGASLAIGSAISMVVLYTPGRDPSRVYFGTDTRAAAILIGVALAGWIAWRGTITSRVARYLLEAIGVVAVAGLAIAWVSLDGQSAGLYQGGFPLLGLGVATVIAVATHPRHGPISRALSLWPLRALGIISYGLYLWHWPIYVTLSADRTGIDGDALLTLRLTTSLAVATASYFIIERPIRTGSLRGRRLVFSSAAAASVCVLAIVATTAGATRSQAPIAQDFVSGGDGTRPPHDATTTTATGIPATSRLLVVGDSVARTIGRAAEDLQGEYGLSIRGAADPCVFTKGAEGYQATLRDGLGLIETFDSCETDWGEEMRGFQPEVVAVIFGTGASFLNPSLDGEWVPPCDPRYQRWYRRQLLSMFSELTQNGVDVFIARLPYGAAPWLPDDADARIDCVNAVHADVARALANVELVDPTADLCPEGRCPEEYAGADVRPDGIHFFPVAAERIARALLTTIT